MNNIIMNNIIMSNINEEKHSNLNFPICELGTAHQVLDNLYASAYPAIPYKNAQQNEFIYKYWKKVGINLVVNLTQESEKLGGLMKYEQAWSKIDPNIQFIRFGIKDRNPAEDESKLKLLIDDLEVALINGQKILIHCRIGRGRSAIACALLIARFYPNWTMDQIIQHMNLCIAKRSYQKNTYHKPNPLNNLQYNQVQHILFTKNDQTYPLTDSGPEQSLNTTSNTNLPTVIKKRTILENSSDVNDSIKKHKNNN